MAVENPFIGNFLSSVILAIIILLTGFIAGKIVGAILRRFLRDIDLDKRAKFTLKTKVSLERLFSALASYIIYLTTLVFSFNVLGLTSAIVTLIFALFLFIAAVSFLLAVKDFFPNLIAGFRVKFGDMFKVGDEIRIKEVRGKVTDIGLLETRIITVLKEEIIIPNRLFIKRQVLVKGK